MRIKVFRVIFGEAQLQLPHYNVFDKLRVVKAVNKLHARIYNITRSRFLHSALISFANSSFDRIVDEVQVSNLEAVINGVFIHEGLDNPDVYFLQRSLSHFGDELRNTRQNPLALDEFHLWTQELQIYLGTFMNL